MCPIFVIAVDGSTVNIEINPLGRVFVLWEELWERQLVDVSCFLLFAGKVLSVGNFFKGLCFGFFFSFSPP